MQEAFHKALPVYSEIELASWFCRGRDFSYFWFKRKDDYNGADRSHISRKRMQDMGLWGTSAFPFSGVVSDVLERDVVVLESFQFSTGSHERI